MRKILPLLLAAFGLLAQAASAESAGGAYDEAKLFDLAHEKSGYRLHLPHYAGTETRVLEADGAAFEAEVHLFDPPAGDGDVLLLEVIVADPEARSLDILIGDEAGYALELKGLEPVDGRAGVTVDRRQWEQAIRDRLLHMDLFTYDRTGEMLWHFFEIYFVHRGEEVRETRAGAGEGEAEAEGVVPAEPILSRVSVDGTTVSFDAYAIGGNIYLKLRDLAMALIASSKPFEVRWDGARNAISLLTGQPYTPAGGELAVTEGRKAAPAAPNRSKIYVDGREVRLTAYTIAGNNYFRLRDIARTFNIGVTWDAAAKTVGLDTSKDYAD
jgi:hypothetical protein